MRRIECSSQGVWVAKVSPTEWVDKFPPCHPVCLAQWNDSKIIFDVITIHIDNLMQDYRKEKVESKETMALEVVSGGKNDKTEKND